MQRKRTLVIVGAAAIAVGLGSMAAARSIDNEEPITGPALEQASVAALAFTGSGRVTATELGDEDSLYEVEVTLDDGSQVDVQLDSNFKVVDSKTEKGDDD